MEQWKDVPGFPGYKASNLGRIIGLRGRVLTTNANTPAGYVQTNVKAEDGTIKHMSQHRMVALAWVPNPTGADCVDHINGIRTDNRPENLRWVTRAENNLNRPDTRELQARIQELEARVAELEAMLSSPSVQL